VEGDEDLFPNKITPEEVRARRKIRIREWKQELKSFKSRKDVFKRADGSFDVKGNVKDLGSKDFKHLARTYGRVAGNFSCGASIESLEGAPQLICGNFSFHGDLKSLKGFPKEVWGDIEFINHPFPENERKAKRWKASDIKKICDVRGKIKVKNHYGL
jgi:hypothetical protein